MNMPRRKLKSDEVELWQQIAKSATPLKLPKNVNTLAKPQSKVAEVKSDQFQLNRFEIGEKATQKSVQNDLKPSISTALDSAPVQMDYKSFKKMKRGKSTPEATFDLHGMTVAQAHSALIHFLMTSYTRNMRLVLVITGKGKFQKDTGPIPRQVGILRHQVPQWLRMPPLRDKVLQVTEAHGKHGGSGAYYVYLRK
ncbi:MAG: Smr/MutS family protein [Paracoccaceae bacterium]